MQFLGDSVEILHLNILQVEVQGRIMILQNVPGEELDSDKLIFLGMIDSLHKTYVHLFITCCQKIMMDFNAT